MNTGGRVVYNSPLGRLTCTFEGPFLKELSIEDDHAHAPFRGRRCTRRDRGQDIPIPVQVVFRELDAYFRGDPAPFFRELYRMEGTGFEKTVWEALLEVPYGEVRTYKWLAGRIGRPGAARAVGQALGRNPLPIVVPCHRIVSSDGTLGGFSCGIEVKKWLLEHERRRSSHKKLRR